MTEERSGERGETLPDVAPDAPPRSEMLWGLCPRCEHKSSFERVESVDMSFDYADRVFGAGRYDPRALDQLVVIQCRGCNQRIAVVEELLRAGVPLREMPRSERQEDPFSPVEWSWRPIHWWPAPGSADLDEAIPKQLREAYAEGIRTLGAEAPRAAAVMLRRTLEGIVRNLGSDKAVRQLDNNDLPGALKIMTNEGTLDTNLSEWAGEVRGLGNVGGHFDPMEDVTVEQATDLAKLVRQMFRYLYEERARVKRLRDSRAGPSGG